MLFLLSACCQTGQTLAKTAEKPFMPEPILSGGVMLSLFPADSPRLKQRFPLVSLA
jgi:hypothetical protein